MMMNHQLGLLQELHLARVLDNDDPESRGRIRVELQATGMQVWAACMTASAGAGYGWSCLPRREEMVVVAFLSPEMPVVMGALWSGGDSHPESAGPVEDKYTLKSPDGTQITLDDADGPRVRVETRSGHHFTITEEGSGEIKVEKDSESITLSADGISVQSGSKVEVNATQVSVSAAQVKVDAGFSDFSGVVKCNTLIATSVVASTYTPGAGNVW